MRQFIVLIVSVFCLATLVNAADDIVFKIKVSVVSDDQPQNQFGSGEFKLPADKYGRISAAFYQKGQDFYLKTSGEGQEPVSYLLLEGKNASAGDLDLMLDLYLKPNITRDDRIELSGTLNKMMRSGTGQPANFSYSEMPVKFIVSNGGEHTLKIAAEEIGLKINLIITAYTSDVYNELSDSYDTDILETDYSLYNKSKNRYEIENHHCSFGGVNDEKGRNNQCSASKQFELKSGKILTYSLDYGLEKIDETGDENLTYNFFATRTYRYKTEKKTFLGKTEKTTKIVETSFSKTLTTEPGEQLEITLPSDKSSELPFDALEKIIVTNPSKYIRLDKMPELSNPSQPAYPPEARDKGIQAEVIVQAYIDKEGNVIRARAVECNRPGYGFEDAAVTAAFNSKYTPGYQNDEPVGVWVKYKVSFNLK